MAEFLTLYVMPAKPVSSHCFKLIAIFCLFIAVCFASVSAFSKGIPLKPALQETKPQLMQWTIAGKMRKALVCIPANAKTQTTPVIFVYHGHGGTMQNAYNTHRFDKLWPEAIIIYPQGLNTVGALTDPEGNLPGWQMAADTLNTDLKFFDAMLQTLKTDYLVDIKRIYVTGHSNGGGFTYLLWAMRGVAFAAVAPTAAVAARLMPLLKPKPALHLMGDTDPLVKPEWQRLTCNYILKLNKCETTGQKLSTYATEYKSATGNPFVIYEHPGGHTYPTEANAVIVDFFKRNTQK